MGKHGDPNRHDTNPLHGLFRKFEPGHTGFEPDPVEHVEPERDPDAVEVFDPVTSTAPTTVIEYGRSLAYPAFEPDPEPYPGEPDDVEPPPDVNLADYELSEADHEMIRRQSPRWPTFLGLSVALCAVVLAAWLGRASADREPLSVPYSAIPSPSVRTVTATPKPVKAKPVPKATVTAWRTRTPEPRVMISRVPVPGPKVVTTRTAKPEPAPTKTVYRECVITIRIDDFGEVIDRNRSGDCS